MWFFFLRQYLLSPFWPRLGTVQVGRAAYVLCSIEESDDRRKTPGHTT
jgi:hypothetical protein